MVIFVSFLQAAQDLDRVLNRRFTHHHRLEAPLKGGIPFDVFAVFIQGGGANALQLTPGQGWLEDVGGIDGAFGCASSNQGVHFVDHQDHVSGTPDFLHDLFEALFEFAPVFGARHQQADIQGQHPLVFKDVGDIAGIDALGQALGNRRFADARFSDKHRVVLGAATQNLDDALNFVLASHHGIEFSVGGLLGEVGAEFIQGWGFGGPFATATAGGNLSCFAEHADHLGADLGQINPKVFEHPGGDAFTLPNEAQQQVLGTDVVVAELTGLFQRQFQNPFGAGSKRNFHGHEARAPADDFFHFNPGVLEVHPHRFEHLGGDAGALTDEPQQDLLGAHKVVTKAAGLLLGQHDHLDGFLGKPLEHGPGPGASAYKLSGLVRLVWFAALGQQISSSRKCFVDFCC